MRTEEDSLLPLSLQKSRTSTVHNEHLSEFRLYCHLKSRPQHVESSSSWSAAMAAMQTQCCRKHLGEWRGNSAWEPPPPKPEWRMTTAQKKALTGSCPPRRKELYSLPRQQPCFDFFAGQSYSSVRSIRSSRSD